MWKALVGFVVIPLLCAPACVLWAVAEDTPPSLNKLKARAGVKAPASRSDTQKTQPVETPPQAGPNAQALNTVLATIGMEKPTSNELMDAFALLSDGRIRATDPPETKASFVLANIKTFLVENYLRAGTAEESAAVARKRQALMNAVKIAPPEK